MSSKSTIKNQSSTEFESTKHRILSEWDYVDETNPEAYEIVDSYSTSEYVDVYILYNNQTSQYLYFADEPNLGEYEPLRADLFDDVDYKITYQSDTTDFTNEELSERVREEALNYLQNKRLTARVQNRLSELLSILNERFEQYSRELDKDTIEKLIYYVDRDFVRNGKVQPLIDDEYIEDIHIDEPNKPTYVFHDKYGQGGNLVTNVVFKKDIMQNVVFSLAQSIGKTVSSANPIVDGSLPDGSRININYGNEITSDGSNITIRLFDEEPLTPVDLVEFGTFSVNQMAYLWLAVENEKSVMFAGGTAAGKTTSLNAISMFIPEKFKIVSIEDTREVELPHDNWVKNTTRESVGEIDDIGMFRLLKDSLRKRPDYIMVGEVRGEEARTLFQAMNTGHATLSTVHADTPKSAVNRLINDPLNVPNAQVTGLDIISVQERYTRDGDDLRRVRDIGEISNDLTEDSQIEINDVYDYDVYEDETYKTYDGSESMVLESIKNRNAWSEEQLLTEIDRREEVLNQLIDEEIKDYQDVTDIVQIYMRDKDRILEATRNNTLREIIE